MNALATQPAVRAGFARSTEIGTLMDRHPAGEATLIESWSTAKPEHLAIFLELAAMLPRYRRDRFDRWFDDAVGEHPALDGLRERQWACIARELGAEPTPAADIAADFGVGLRRLVDHTMPRLDRLGPDAVADFLSLLHGAEQFAELAP